MSKINFVIRLQRWMDSVPGQTFLNYAYSWGAAIVILGALFKLTHLPGGNLMLYIGMGTEVFVFFLSAFDRPFDKTEIGKELPRELESDEEIEAALEKEAEQYLSPKSTTYVATTAPTTPIQSVAATTDSEKATFVSKTEEKIATASATTPTAPAAQVAATPTTAALSEGGKLQEASLAAINDLETAAQRAATMAVLTPEMEAATSAYIERLHTLTETLSKVDAQSARLAHDNDEMERLSRTLTSINSIYELQLKGASSQIASIDQINEQTRHLVQQIEELNAVYARMIQAMTVNTKSVSQ